MPHPVVHFEIMTKDADSLADFYREAFGWEAGPFGGGAGAGGVKYNIVRPTGEEFPARSINGGIGDAPADYGGHVTFYIAVDDIAAALGKVESLGGKPMLGPEQVPGGPLIGLFADPQGHVIGLVTPEM